MSIGDLEDVAVQLESIVHGDDSSVALDDDDLKYITKEAEHERRDGPGSPHPPSPGFC